MSEVEINTVKSLSIIKRFLSKTKFVDNGCVEWGGVIMHAGYGMFYYDYKRIKAHRYSYMVANGLSSLMSNQHVCHSCDNTKCVNPEHLWLGDAKSNAQDCISKGRHSNQKKTHCKRGHEFTRENTYLMKRASGGRVCRKCNRKTALKDTNDE